MSLFDNIFHDDHGRRAFAAKIPLSEAFNLSSDNPTEQVAIAGYKDAARLAKLEIDQLLNT